MDRASFPERRTGKRHDELQCASARPPYSPRAGECILGNEPREQRANAPLDFSCGHPEQVDTALQFLGVVVNKSGGSLFQTGRLHRFPFDVDLESNTPITFPKLHVVLATNRSARRLAACSSMQSSFAAQITCRVRCTTNTLYRMMAVPSKRGTRHVSRMSLQSSAKLSAGAWNLCTCGIRLYRRYLIDRGRRVT
ncbi:hypothetical protein ABIB68_006433 [Bradyrhizobium sp. F1.2.2]